VTFSGAALPPHASIFVAGNYRDIELIAQNTFSFFSVRMRDFVLSLLAIWHVVGSLFPA